MLDDLGLAAALEQLTRELAEQTGIEIAFTQAAPKPASRKAQASALPDAVNTVLFRIAQEALTNIVRHAQAARAALTLEVTANGVTLRIADNGRGFDVTHALTDPRAGLGLRNMRERLESLGGRLDITSQPGHTLVTAWVPVATHAASKAAAVSGTPT